MSRQNHSILKLICLLNHFHFRQKETEFLRGTSDKKETGSVGFCRTQDQNFYLIWSIWNYVEIKCPRCSCSSFKMSFFIANRHIYVLQTWWNKFNQTRKKLSSKIQTTWKFSSGQMQILCQSENRKKSTIIFTQFLWIFWAIQVTVRPV